MGKEGTSSFEERIAWKAALSFLVLLVVQPGPASADCPGPGCPAIAFGVVDCPGPACPVFRQTLRDQMEYIDLFGAFQSAREVPRPIEGRLILEIPLAENEGELPPDFDAAISGACSVLVEEGVSRAELIGPMPEDRNTVPAVAEAIFSRFEDICAPPLCDPSSCPEIKPRAPIPSDALPDSGDSDLRSTFFELRVLP